MMLSARAFWMSSQGARAVLVAGLLVALSACGSDDEAASVTNVLVSPEEQRADLLEARARGVISEEEYEEQLLKIGE